MDGKRAALALIVSFVVACGGAAPATGGSSAPSAAATTAATAAATSAATASAQASAADASAQLAATLGLAKNATYKVTYKLTASGGGADAFSGEQTWYFKPPRARFDFSTLQGGTKLTISFFSLPEGSFYCFSLGVVQCLTVAGTGSPLDQNAAAVAQQSLIGNPSGFGATPSTAKTIAGQTASCYDVTSKGGTTAFDSGTFCYSKEGVPLLSSFTTAQYASWSMEATNYSTTVADADFTLPAKPISR
jgi:hypothetical protein